MTPTRRDFDHIETELKEIRKSLKDNWISVGPNHRQAGDVLADRLQELRQFTISCRERYSRVTSQKYYTEHLTTSGWEEAPGFCRHDTLPGALKELAEFILETHEEYQEGRLSQPYNIENYRIMQGDEPIISFDPK